MDDSLFQYYIRNIVLPLYPNISNKCLIVDGKVIKGPVILKTDSGPGRMKEDITHINFLEEMNNIGLKVILSLPNATSVHADLDQFFGPYKGNCRSRTMDHFSEKLQDKIEKIKYNMEKNKKRMNSKTVEEMTIMKNKLNTRRDDPEFGDHHDDTDEKLSVIKCVIGLTNHDLSVMINGKPSEIGRAHV